MTQKNNKSTLIGTFAEHDRNARKTGRLVDLFRSESPLHAVDRDGTEYKELWPGAYYRGYFKFLLI